MVGHFVTFAGFRSGQCSGGGRPASRSEVGLSGGVRLMSVKLVRVSRESWEHEQHSAAGAGVRPACLDICRKVEGDGI